MRIVWAVLLLYAAGFLCFYPRALTNFDEVSYVRQAVSFAHGQRHGGRRRSVYRPASKSASQRLSGRHLGVDVPFVWLAGWRGTFLLGLLRSRPARCSRRAGSPIREVSPLYALAVLGYLPAMVMARTGMSDLPSACLVAAGLWLFWEDNQSTPWRRLAAGFLAGASICLREPNPVLFAIFFAGALFRRERHMVALILGGLAGVALPASDSPRWSTAIRFSSRTTSMDSRASTRERT